MIINDDLGAFLKVPTAMGNRAARLVDQLFFKRLLQNPTGVDGKALFCRDHKNLLSGANSALSADSLKKAIQLFTDQVDSDGQPINVEPSILLVPTSLKFLAAELTQGTTLIMSGGADNVVRPAINVLADENLKIVSSPYLSNSKYAGSSEAAWYFFGKPGVVDTFEIGYLKGKRTPTVERISLSPQGLPRSGALAGVRPGLQRPRHLVPRVLRHRHPRAGSSRHGQGVRRGRLTEAANHLRRDIGFLVVSSPMPRRLFSTHRRKV